MNFSPNDINSALHKGIGPKDPRFLRTVAENKIRRESSLQDMRVRGLLAGTKAEAAYPTARHWLAANPGTHAPIWLGHNPETTILSRGDRKFVLFAAKGSHKATVFEILGQRFQRLL